MTNFPPIIIVYLPGDDSMQIFGARPDGDDWQYSGPNTHSVKADYQEMMDEAAEMGYSKHDVRWLAQKRRPGLETATPIILYRDVTFEQAHAAFAKLHKELVVQAKKRAD